MAFNGGIVNAYTTVLISYVRVVIAISYLVGEVEGRLTVTENERIATGCGKRVSMVELRRRDSRGSGMHGWNVTARDRLTLRGVSTVVPAIRGRTYGGHDMPIDS